MTSGKSLLMAVCAAGALLAASATLQVASAGPAGVAQSRTAAVAQGNGAVELVGSSSKNGARVKGYTERRGGYSYSQEDSINTYGDSRSKYGGASSLRDPSLDTQTQSGPFDHGFFFDSGTRARGGDSPYMN